MLIPFKELWKRHNVKPNGVLHLGANTGQEAAEYIRHNVPFVIWVEALPLAYRRLAQNVGRFPNHVPLQACVSDVDDQEVTFHVANNEGQSSSFLDFGTHTKEHPTVFYTSHIKMKTVRVDTLFKRCTIDLDSGGWFLNADLQGAELLALKGMGELLRKFDYAYIEVNERELYRGCALVGEIDEYLARFGFVPKEVKMTGAGWGDKFYTRFV